MSKFSKYIEGIRVYTEHVASLCYVRDGKDSFVPLDLCSEVVCSTRECFFSNLNKFFNKYNAEYFYIQFYKDRAVSQLKLDKTRELFMKYGFSIDKGERFLTVKKLSIGENVLVNI